ncbi:hypothetical protein P8452_25928 [Trifolium repens]|nr:hypothetical protein P8452_25928 [Trifolium repens]
MSKSVEICSVDCGYTNLAAAAPIPCRTIADCPPSWIDCGYTKLKYSGAPPCDSVIDCPPSVCRKELIADIQT